MSFETLREKVWVFFPPLIALVRLHGWITKDSNRGAVQRLGGALLEWEKHGEGWCAPASFLPSLSHSLCQRLWVSITPQSKWMVGKDYCRVKPPLLMSPVFNHHTVEWFYAYFICISLSHVSKGALRARRSTKLGRQARKKREIPYDAHLQTGACSMLCLLLLLKSLWLGNLWSWIQPWILLIPAERYIFKNSSNVPALDN